MKARSLASSARSRANIAQGHEFGGLITDRHRLSDRRNMTGRVRPAHINPGGLGGPALDDWVSAAASFAASLPRP